MSWAINSGVSLEVDANARALERHLAVLSHLGHERLAADVGADIGEYMLGQIQDRFDDQRLVDGSPMPQSAAARERDGKTLIDRHHLYDSYVYQLVPGGVVVGSNRAYARIHHFGGQTGRNGSVTLPARPVLGTNADDERVIGQIIIAELQRLAPGGAA